MIRPIFTEVALFVLPFAVYALYLLVTRAEVFDPEEWGLKTLTWLTGAGLVLMVASFVLLAQFSGAPPGSTYVPAHVEDGRLVPGTTQ
jgi:hypothetical protein